MPNSIIFGYDKYVPYIIEQVSIYSKVEFVIYPKNRADRIAPELLDFANEKGIEMLELPYYKSRSDIKSFLRNFINKEYDLFLIFSFSQLLPESLFRIPKLGAINVHGGELPRYRGSHILNYW